jgi:hypothetical protein
VDSAVVAAVVALAAAGVASAPAVAALVVEPGTVSAAAAVDSAVQQGAAPVVLVAVDSTRVRRAAPALADRAVDGLAVQDSEGLVRRDPVLDDLVAQDLADQAQQVSEVVEPVAAWTGNDPPAKRRIGSPSPAPVN